jgi:hypothetical protein
MIPIRSAIERMAATVSTTALPLSSACSACSFAIASVWRLFSAFWVMDPSISSRAEVVSSTDAACSPVPWESV